MGIAFDFYRNDGQGAYNESGDFFRRVGQIAKSIGLGWGGDWTSIVDKPHLYLPDWGSGTGILKQQYGSFEAFEATWEKEKKVWEYQSIGTSAGKVEVTATSLIVRDSPGGGDTGARYKAGDLVIPTEKALSGSERWFKTDKGWISANYLEGWISESGRWWYLQPGYTYPTGRLEIINGKCYCFDFNGWMLTGDRIREDGEVI